MDEDDRACVSCQHEWEIHSERDVVLKTTECGHRLCSDCEPRLFQRSASIRCPRCGTAISRARLRKESPGFLRFKEECNVRATVTDVMNRELRDFEASFPGDPKRARAAFDEYLEQVELLVRDQLDGTEEEKRRAKQTLRQYQTEHAREIALIKDRRAREGDERFRAVVRQRDLRLEHARVLESQRHAFRQLRGASADRLREFLRDMRAASGEEAESARAEDADRGGRRVGVEATPDDRALLGRGVAPTWMHREPIRLLAIVKPPSRVPHDAEVARPAKTSNASTAATDDATTSSSSSSSSGLRALLARVDRASLQRWLRCLGRGRSRSSAAVEPLRRKRAREDLEEARDGVEARHEAVGTDTSPEASAWDASAAAGGGSGGSGGSGGDTAALLTSSSTTSSTSSAAVGSASGDALAMAVRLRHAHRVHVEASHPVVYALKCMAREAGGYDEDAVARRQRAEALRSLRLPTAALRPAVPSAEPQVLDARPPE